MSRRRPARSDRKAEEADVSYDIALPFEDRNASIYLFAQDDDPIEVLIGNIPEPYFYYDNYNTDERDKLDQHAIAHWIFEEAATELEDWDYQTSSYKTNNPNYHLRDVYFECDRSEINEAVLAAKRFLIALEEKVVAQKLMIDKEFSESPLRDLPE